MPENGTNGCRRTSVGHPPRWPLPGSRRSYPRPTPPLGNDKGILYHNIYRYHIYTYICAYQEKRIEGELTAATWIPKIIPIHPKKFYGVLRYYYYISMDIVIKNYKSLILK